MPVKKRKKHIKVTRRKRKNGGSVGGGTLYVIFILLLLGVAAFTMIGGRLPSPNPNQTGQQVTIVTPKPDKTTSTLQLKTFGYATIIPTQAQQSSLCNDKSINNEPEILVGYAPSSGQSVGADGQIKVWATDEGAPMIAPGEQVNNSTGQITTPGDRTAKASDGYLYEPALYISPQTAENGGTPHFPTIIKGDYNNAPRNLSQGQKSVPIDPPPTNARLIRYTAEFIWDVNSLGLGPGSYQAEFVIHDGDVDRGVGCVSVNIQ